MWCFWALKLFVANVTHVSVFELEWYFTARLTIFSAKNSNALKQHLEFKLNFHFENSYHYCPCFMSNNSRLELNPSIITVAQNVFK